MERLWNLETSFTQKSLSIQQGSIYNLFYEMHNNEIKKSSNIFVLLRERP